MAHTYRVSLVGYNALTDTDPNHFALFADQDNVLIKEKVRGSESVNNGATDNIAHGLSYIPMCFVFVEVASGVWQKAYGHDFDGSGVYFSVNSTNVRLHNFSGSTKIFKYQIFYDEVA